MVCPAGFKEVDGKCEQCPLDHYSDAEKQTECQPCPSGKKTLELGSDNQDKCIGSIFESFSIRGGQLICSSYIVAL